MGDNMDLIRKMDCEDGSGSCSMASFGISSIETSSPAIRPLITL
jgi:hypothetical protein